jgi:hypothetical protein
MNTELDKVKSTITISLGLKNRLRDVKGSSSYEDYIAYLLRTKNLQLQNENYIEVQKFQRIEMVYSMNTFKIIFSFNKFNISPNHIFDIQIDTIRVAGKKISPIKFGNESLNSEYKLYFELLETAIQGSIEPLFSHKGTFENYVTWQKEFDLLGLSKKAFENDVMEKLNDFKNGVHYK